MRSDKDGAGNCYDWYEIDRHYRATDKTGPLAKQMAQNAADAETALCELDAATEERLTAVEEALCELDNALNGGGETA